MFDTRLDLACIVQHLSQYMQQPRISHFRVVSHVLTYIKGQLELGIFLYKNADFTLEAYCDSDWASCSHARKSVSGLCGLIREESYFMEIEETGDCFSFIRRG